MAVASPLTLWAVFVDYFRVPLAACGHRMAGERQPVFWRKTAQQLRKLVQLSRLGLERLFI